MLIKLFQSFKKAREEYERPVVVIKPNDPDHLEFIQRWPWIRILDEGDIPPDVKFFLYVGNSEFKARMKLSSNPKGKVEQETPIETRRRIQDFMHEVNERSPIYTISDLMNIAYNQKVINR